jgi:hypothetical protein
VNFGYDVVVYGKPEVARTGFLKSLGFLLWGAFYNSQFEIVFYNQTVVVTYSDS